MSDDPVAWLHYAEENLQVAKVTLGIGLFNATLQNSQQAVEKALKGLCLARGIGIKKTHSVSELVYLLEQDGVAPMLSEDESALIDAIYLPSKYPLESVIPDFQPDRALGDRCHGLAKRVVHEVRVYLGRSDHMANE